MYLIKDSFNGYFSSIYDIFFVISVVCAILVITMKNPVISVLFLIGLFISVAIYLIISGMGFIGLAYLLVYVGAISMLFLFILMLINVRISELVSDSKNSVPLVFLVTVLFAGVGYIIFPQKYQMYDPVIASTWNWEVNLGGFGHIFSIGNVMYSNLAVWLLQVCLILLIAMVGAIVINISKDTKKLNRPYVVDMPLKSTSPIIELVTKAIKEFVSHSDSCCLKCRRCKKSFYNKSKL